MVIQAYYYLDYPNDGRTNPRNATSRMRFEVAEDNAALNDLIGIYEVVAITYQYLTHEVITANKPLISGPMVLVPTLDDEWMTEFLTASIDTLLQVAIDVS